MDTKTQLYAQRGDQLKVTTWGFVAWHLIGAKNKAKLRDALDSFDSDGHWTMETLQQPIRFTLIDRSEA
jgi:hypothetical protein